MYQRQEEPGSWAWTLVSHGYEVRPWDRKEEGHEDRAGGAGLSEAVLLGGQGGQARAPWTLRVTNLTAMSLSGQTALRLKPVPAPQSAKKPFTGSTVHL